MSRAYRVMIPAYLIACLAIFMQAGCTVGPDYQKPQMEIPAHYRESGKWTTAQPMDNSPRGPWWTIFSDPELDRLMELLNRQNLSIIQAEAQYRQSQALLRQARAGLFPMVSATGSSSHGVLTRDAKVSDQYSLEAGAGWEIDIWGGVRRAIEAGEDRQAASGFQLAAVRLSSQAQLAAAYLQLRVADTQLDQLQASENTLQRTLTITRNQYSAGIVSQASVVLAESQLKTAQSQRVQKKLVRQQLEHGIAAALGLAPAAFSLPPATSLPRLPVVPAGLPSTLLQRRPDIGAAERSVAAANAQIGVATAAFFPVLTLSASTGYLGTSLGDWINAPNHIWSLGPQLAGTLFDGGLRRAQKDEAIAAYDTSVASYRQTVINALQAVEDNLSAQYLLAQAAGLQQGALTAAQRAEQITLNQYRAGTVGYIEVLAAQNSRILAEAALWNIKNNQYTGSVALINAIGGSW